MSSIAQLCCAVVLLSAVAGVAGADTQRPGTFASTGTQLLAPVAPPKNPYGALFLLPGQAALRTGPRLAAPSRVRAATAPAAPTVVCGTRLVPIDPSIDAGIRRVPDPAAPRPAVRAVEPTLCR